jgi:hypothetical protein
MAKAKPKAVNPQPPAGNALKRGGDRPVEDMSEDPLKEVNDNVEQSAMSGGSARTLDQTILADTPQPAPRGSAEEVSGEISSEERQRMIEEAAYYCSQRRQQEGREGSPNDDWAEAEAQIDRLLEEQRNRKRD